jgi:hypothetical protein
MFSKTQISYFYQGYFNHDINSKQNIFHQLETSNTKNPHESH